MIRLAVGLMARNKPDINNLRGIVINSAGIEGLQGQISQSVTAAASGGIIGKTSLKSAGKQIQIKITFFFLAMTKPLAADLNVHGIRVVTIVPGIFESKIFSPRLELRQDFEKFCQTAPKQMGEPEYFAHLAKSCIINPAMNATILEITAGLVLE